MMRRQFEHAIDRARRLLIIVQQAGADPALALTPAVEQALVETIYRQSIRIPIPVTTVALLVSGIGWGRVPTYILAAWVTSVVAMQFVRLRTVRPLVNARDTQLGGRMRRITAISAVNGFVVALSVGFFPFLDDVSRPIHAMTIIGMTTAAVAISHGYRPMYHAFAGPVLGSLVVAWVIVDSVSIEPWVRYAVALLIAALFLLLRGLARDSFTAFVENFRINAALARSLRAEQSANNAKTRFLASASHDLRQPLHALSLLSAALSIRPLDDRSASIARNINEAISDLAAELDSLLDISKLDAGVVRVQAETFQVGALLTRISAQFAEPAKRKGLSLEVEQEAVVSVRTDRILLERIFRNLIDNAIKYTSQGEVRICVRKHGNFCEVSVSDTGHGIALVEHERVFDEFYQIGNVERDRKKGLGLGLSIVRRLVSLLDCRLALESAPGHGTTFRVTIPIAAADSTSQVVSRPVVHGDLSGIRFLLIEDDVGVRTATRLLLEELGGVVDEAASTTEAISKATRANPDIVLADIRLPEGDSGFDAVAQLRRLDPQLRLLMISGETSPERLRQADRLGSTLLIKPVDQAILIDSIRRLLAEPTLSK